MTDHSVCFDSGGWLVRVHSAETGEVAGWRRWDDGTISFVGNPPYFVERIKGWVDGALSAGTLRQREHERHSAEVARLQSTVLELSEQKEALASELEHLRDAAHRQAAEIEQILGKALGYPADGDGVCVGEHTPESLAMEVAEKIARLTFTQEALENDK